MTAALLVFALASLLIDLTPGPNMAYLAILPKAPETYGRARNADKAIARRNFVLSEMFRNGWITAAQRDAAQAMPLGLSETGNKAVAQVGGYYMEEVRRQLIDQFG